MRAERAERAQRTAGWDPFRSIEGERKTIVEPAAFDRAADRRRATVRVPGVEARAERVAPARGQPVAHREPAMRARLAPLARAIGAVRFRFPTAVDAPHAGQAAHARRRERRRDAR